MNQVETGERDDKHDPAGELVKEAERFIRIPILHAEAGPDDADNVGGNGDRNARQSKNDAAFRGFLEKVPIKNGQGEQAHQGAYTAACLRYFELHDWKFDDIALMKRGNSQHRQDVAGDP